MTTRTATIVRTLLTVGMAVGLGTADYGVGHAALTWDANAQVGTPPSSQTCIDNPVSFSASESVTVEGNNGEQGTFEYHMWCYYDVDVDDNTLSPEVQTSSSVTISDPPGYWSNQATQGESRSLSTGNHTVRAKSEIWPYSQPQYKSSASDTESFCVN